MHQPVPAVTNLAGPVVVRWGLRTSFREYFERLADHEYRLSGGAGLSEQGQFVFPGHAQAGAAPGRPGVIRCRGRVQMSAHFGALSVLIADPEIVIGDDGQGILTAVVDEHGDAPVRMEVARLSLDGSPEGDPAPRWQWAAVLAEEGQFLFMGSYFAGDPLDPVCVHAGGRPDPDPGAE
ncbi:HtaA domain-containing protein [Citricoccus sp. SGAir0253]|uniref:HtaA domain-containing protein n=1 Tax=Citricoccus sp. SGAir0253 TaxID=2567881 RepID=UPI00143D6110|nr:HtaA domain-containing protein [Citricoccus sp. SGAir0253]